MCRSVDKSVVGFGPSSGSLLSDTDALIGELRSVNPAMEVIARPRSIEVNGAPGLLTELWAASPYGGEERDLVLTLRRPQGFMYVVFVAPERAFEQV